MIFTTTVYDTPCFSPPHLPLYVGHSRTVVGVEYSSTGNPRDVKLFMYDPLHSAGDLNKMAATLIDSPPMILRSVADECRDEYEIVFVQGLLHEREIEVRTHHMHTRVNLHTSRLMQSVLRIPHIL